MADHNQLQLHGESSAGPRGHLCLDAEMPASRLGAVAHSLHGICEQVIRAHGVLIAEKLYPRRCVCLTQAVRMILLLWRAGAVHFAKTKGRTRPTALNARA